MKRLLMMGAALWMSAAAFAQPVFLESGGLVVVEVESVEPATNWQLRTVRPDYTGEGYVEFLGPESFSSPNSNSIMTYQIFVTTPGTYDFRLRSQRNGATTDIENDSWVRCNGSAWEKHFITGGAPSHAFTFETIEEVTHGVFAPPKFNLVAGLNTIQIGGRSAKHKLDRFHMYLPSVSNPLDATLPQSDIEGAGSGPGSYTFDFVDNANGFVSGNIAPTLAATNNYVHFQGLAMNAAGAGDNISFGYWEKFLTDTTLSAGKTYKVDFTIVTTAQNGRAHIPAFRFRVSDGSFQSTALMNVESSGDATVVPDDFENKTYTMFYTVPEGAEGQALFVAFDYLYVPGENHANTTISLKKLVITRMNTP